MKAEAEAGNQSYIELGMSEINEYADKCKDVETEGK